VGGGRGHSVHAGAIQRSVSDPASRLAGHPLDVGACSVGCHGIGVLIVRVSRRCAIGPAWARVHAVGRTGAADRSRSDAGVRPRRAGSGLGRGVVGIAYGIHARIVQRLDRRSRAGRIAWDGIRHVQSDDGGRVIGRQRSGGCTVGCRRPPCDVHGGRRFCSPDPDCAMDLAHPVARKAIAASSHWRQSHYKRWQRKNPPRSERQSLSSNGCLLSTITPEGKLKTCYGNDQTSLNYSAQSYLDHRKQRPSLVQGA